ncbi:unnamed protein product [Blepharisma stoltei]|uniref:Uncharacterized protein n=1 Tax=Blepharisma stoltei TaxID=1481888 RepID=A0AAU9IQJ4_9CILI|nr:unnamed protein product [Blepharisma stoltei]
MSQEAKLRLEMKKLKAENKQLQQLLVNAESEMTNIIKKSQEESKQLQSLFESVWPQIQQKLQSKHDSYLSDMSTASNEKKSAAIQTDEDSTWDENIISLENCLNYLENSANDLVNQQMITQAELEHAQKRENSLSQVVKSYQQQIEALELDIAQLKNQADKLKEENTLISQHLEYGNLIGEPIPAIFSIFNQS